MSTLSKSLSSAAVTAIQPLPSLRTLPYFLLPGLALHLTVYRGIPLMERAGLAPFEAFIIAFTVPFAILFALAFGLTQAEGIPMTHGALVERWRMHRPTWRQLVWTLGGLVVIMLLSGALSPTRILLLRAFPALQPPSIFPPILDPTLQNSTLPQTVMDWMGPEVGGRWTWAILALVLFFFNNVGEELYFRGYLLPRQELAVGKWAWLVQALLWNAYHLFFYPWYLVFGLSLTLVIPFIAQQTRNTWTAILMHGLLNLPLTLLMVSVALGGN